MELSIGWGSTLQTIAIPLDLASADDKSKWTYIQNRIVGSSHTVALCAAFQELYPGLGFTGSRETPLPYDVAVFGTPAAELYGKPDTSPLNSSLPESPLPKNTHSHRRPPLSTSRPSTHGGSGTKVPDRRLPLPSISTPSQPLFRRPVAGSPLRPSQRPMQSATANKAGPPAAIATRI
jgi:hypothetical protein